MSWFSDCNYIQVLQCCLQHPGRQQRSCMVPQKCGALMPASRLVVLELFGGSHSLHCTGLSWLACQQHLVLRAVNGVKLGVANATLMLPFIIIIIICIHARRIYNQRCASRHLFLLILVLALCRVVTWEIGTETVGSGAVSWIKQYKIGWKSFFLLN